MAFPGPKSMNRSICFLKQAALWSMSSFVSILRMSVRPDGSPIMVVPPPISAIGFIRQSAIKWPTCSESAVQSKPM